MDKRALNEPSYPKYSKVLNILRNEKRNEGDSMSEEIKVAPMHKLIKRAGAQRVSEESAIALGLALEEIGLKVAKEAIDYAHHAGRKTVKARDVEIAAKKVLER